MVNPSDRHLSNLFRGFTLEPLEKVARITSMARAQEAVKQKKANGQLFITITDSFLFLPLYFSM